MTLNKALKKKVYLVEDLTASASQKSRFLKLGIYPGAKLSLMRKAPIFFDPMIFQVDDSQIMMTKAEASLIEVSVVEA